MDSFLSMGKIRQPEHRQYPLSSWQQAIAAKMAQLAASPTTFTRKKHQKVVLHITQGISMVSAGAQKFSNQSMGINTLHHSTPKTSTHVPRHAQGQGLLAGCHKDIGTKVHLSNPTGDQTLQKCLSKSWVQKALPHIFMHIYLCILLYTYFEIFIYMDCKYIYSLRNNNESCTLS